MIESRTIALILGAVVFSVAGQLCLKSGAHDLAGLGPVDFLIGASRNVNILAGVAAFAASTVCWLYVLRVAPLSRTYGLTSLTYVLVPAASVYLFGEHFRRMHGVGTLLILIGVACLLSGD